MGLRLHFVVDPMGWFCSSMVIFVWLYNSLLIPELVLLPHVQEGHISSALLVLYYLASLFCVTALFRASTTDPGRLPVNPHIPHSEREQWELCNKCNLMRPKRSHHCSRCGHCVRKMDHHCPWINNCVGEDNHWLFLQLCFYTQVLSLFTLALDFCQYYYFPPLVRTEERLFYTQITGLLSDTTTIEKMSHFLEEINGPRRPWQQTFEEVFGTRWKVLWFLPFRRRQTLLGSQLPPGRV
ncbi:hypothetical protein GJAV_G00167710 [Gymnothorax javanicus]|nr:hypothetical protein GJAV_G00167710 [Gymnothorax javanicus]